MKLKKILCVILSVLMLGSVFITTAYAYDPHESYTSIKTKFIDGESLLDYCYFSPVKGEDDNLKYPLIVWLHGNKSGDYKRHQLNNCRAGFWACEEAQAQFNNGGAFIYLPRHETIGLTVGDLSWDGATDILKKCVDKFIAENEKNIDKTRIYVGGYSMGGKGAFKQLCNFPGFYAAGFLMSTVYTPLPNEAAALKNTPVWMFNCKGDWKPNLDPASVALFWNELTTNTNVPDRIRHTTFDYAYNMSGSIKEGDTHNTWDAVASDLFILGTDKPFEGMHTVDGNGNNVEIKYPEGFLYWLNSQHLEEDTPHVIPGISIIDKILGFFHMIINFFRNLFK